MRVRASVQARKHARREQANRLDLLPCHERLVGHLLEDVAHLVEVFVKLFKMLCHSIRLLLEDAVGYEHLQVLPHNHEDVVHGGLAGRKPLLPMDDRQVLVDPVRAEALGCSRLELKGETLEAVKAFSQENIVGCVDSLYPILEVKHEVYAFIV